MPAAHGAQHARPRHGRDGLEEAELLLRQQLRPLRRLLHRRPRLRPARADGETEGAGCDEGGDATQITHTRTISAFIDCLRERGREREGVIIIVSDLVGGGGDGGLD